MMAWSTLSGLVQLMSLDKKEIKTLGHHSSAKVTLLKFSPSDTLLLTVSSDGCIKVIAKPRLTLYKYFNKLVTFTMKDVETERRSCYY